MLRASTAVRKLPTYQLLDLLQDDREYRAKLDFSEGLEKFEKTVQGWVTEYKKERGLDQPTKAWKVNIGVKVGFPPSLSVNLAKELEASSKKGFFARRRQERNKRKIKPEQLLKQSISKGTEQRIWGQVTSEMMSVELYRRGIHNLNPREITQGQQTLLIRDQDLVAEPNRQGYHSIRSGIAQILTSHHEAEPSITRINIQTSKPVSLPENIERAEAKLSSLAPLQAGNLSVQDIDSKNLMAKTITARTLHVDGNLLATDVRVKAYTEIKGTADIRKWKGTTLLVKKNANVTSFQGDTIRVTGNLRGMRGEARQLTVLRNLALSGPLKITQEVAVLGKAQASSWNLSKSAKTTGPSLNKALAKNSRQSTSPKQNHKL